MKRLIFFFLTLIASRLLRFTTPRRLSLVEPRLPLVFAHSNQSARRDYPHLITRSLTLSISSPLTSPLPTQSSIASSPAPGTMCTFFSLTYQCGHTQTSHRCPRSTVYVHGKDGEQVPQINGCEVTHVLGGGLPDICIDCKMAEGHMPGVTTGVDKWSLWGPKEDAMAARVKMMEAGVSEISNSPIEGSMVEGTVQHVKSGFSANGRVAEGWEEQVRAVLMNQGRGQMGTPETMASSARSGSMQTEWRQGKRRVKEQDEEDDDWMWGGMKSFGGKEGRKRGKAATLRNTRA
ncbi:hypothetical protein DPSP01_001712 [Paraphaeosphaeria sporulosa]|uniref:Uncharacterized protein n=1 Tax=Paraphaeosphaeria sporulosa TaxID=1460663 RepID=A0A177CRM2_9PLEO|nr:uncharacterized protein CC84DRAFT_1202698 [Paraphaeosphaeria sporulosa]OAG10175.1 hypothetical protein CC84DRAFT_1202698 [Paraphaeosphaeria sporulosa]